MLASGNRSNSNSSGHRGLYRTPTTDSVIDSSINEYESMSRAPLVQSLGAEKPE